MGEPPRGLAAEATEAAAAECGTPADIMALTMEATWAAGGTLEGGAPCAGGGGAAMPELR